MQAYDQAIASFRQALHLKRDYAEAHYNIGLALQQKGQYEAAIASLRLALQLKPQMAEAQQALGVQFCRLERYEEAAL